MRMWKSLNERYPDSAHYSVFSLRDGCDGMDALREIFPDGCANEMNFCLFSTSGVHGTYNTIEEAEAFLSGTATDNSAEITFIVMQPRRVAIYYGVCNPSSFEDIAFLKKLRATSYVAVVQIGQPR